MIRKAIVVVAVCFLIGLVGLGRDALAGGLIGYELGAPDVGRASAGWAARADDAATLFTNPAGMSRLSGPHLLLGSQLTYGQFGFKSNENTTVSGNDGGNPVGAIPVGGVFFTHGLSSGWNVGIGAFSYFGLSAEYDPGWVGRYYVQKSALIGFTVMPAVSYKVNEHLSFGAGFNWMFGMLEQELAVRNFVQATDGSFKLSDDTQGFGANAGVLGQISDGTRLGLTYLSPVKLDFKDVPEFIGLGPVTDSVLKRFGIYGAEINLGMTVPQTLMASVYHELSNRWALMGNVGWQNWNAFGKTRVSIADTLLSTTTDLEYKDTWHGALGASWNVSPKWLFSGGVAYDSSPVDDGNRTLDIPMSDSWRFGIGGQWDASPKIRLGLAYELTWMGNMAIDQYRQIGSVVVNRVAGEYENTALHAFVANLAWRI